MRHQGLRYGRYCCVVGRMHTNLHMVWCLEWCEQVWGLSIHLAWTGDKQVLINWNNRRVIEALSCHAYANRLLSICEGSLSVCYAWRQGCAVVWLDGGTCDLRPYIHTYTLISFHHFFTTFLQKFTIYHRKVTLVMESEGLGKAGSACQLPYW